MSKSYEIVRGGYVAIEDGKAWGIAAYEGAEDEIEDWCDSHGVSLKSIHLVCGWEEADERMRSWGYELEES